MSLRLKLILILSFEVALTVTLAGFLLYRESKWKIKDLARDLLVAKTEKAFALCEHHFRSSPEPSDELKIEIGGVQIAKDGYIAVLSNQDGPQKGVLVIHPSEVGKALYIDEFPHIKNILDEIDRSGKSYGYSNFTQYRQGTSARGRQDEKKFGYFKYFPPWDWVILATSYEQDVFSSRDQLRAVLIPVVAVIIFLGATLVYFTIGKMFRPIEKLTASTKEVAQGNWDVSIDYHSDDEVGVLATSFNKMVRSLKENARVMHEFNVARDMQSQMLPDKFPELAGIEIGAKSIPTTEVGGDFYDFLDLEAGRIGLVIGDVSGHGLSSAMVMTAAMSAVRFAAGERQRTHEVLAMVNSRLKKDTQPHMFVALFYGIYDINAGKLYYTNAGQTMPYIFRNGEVRFLPQAEESDCFPLGIVASPNYEQLSIDLGPGDTIVFYTDGIVDAMNGSSENYGFTRFSESIKSHAKLPPQEMIEGLISGMYRYSGSHSQDDVTLVIFKIT